MCYPNMMTLLLLTCSLSAWTVAGEQRQHDVHEHGGGTLDVAVEDNRLMIELSLPAMNVVGFEHAAKNAEESEQIQQAAGLLGEGSSLFAPSAAAECSLKQVNVQSALLASAEEHHESAHHHKHEHADFDAVYEFLCRQPEQLNSLTVLLFNQLPATEHLDAQLVTPAVQTGYELSREYNVLKLK